MLTASQVAQTQRFRTHATIYDYLSNWQLCKCDYCASVPKWTQVTGVLIASPLLAWLILFKPLQSYHNATYSDQPVRCSLRYCITAPST